MFNYEKQMIRDNLKLVKDGRTDFTSFDIRHHHIRIDNTDDGIFAVIDYCKEVRVENANLLIAEIESLN